MLPSTWFAKYCFELITCVHSMCIVSLDMCRQGNCLLRWQPCTQTNRDHSSTCPPALLCFPVIYFMLFRVTTGSNRIKQDQFCLNRKSVCQIMITLLFALVGGQFLQEFSCFSRELSCLILNARNKYDFNCFGCFRLVCRQVTPSKRTNYKRALVV